MDHSQAPVLEALAEFHRRGIVVYGPREAFFAAVEQVPIEQAEGRIAAEMASPYPPGVPAVAPGERHQRRPVASTGAARDWWDRPATAG